MDSTIYAAFIGALVGGIVPVLGMSVKSYYDRKNMHEQHNLDIEKMFEEYKLSMDKDAKNRQASFDLECRREEASRQRDAARRYIERQMEEFYGPLAGLLQQSKDIYDILVERRSKYERDNSVEDYFTSHYFVPINREIFDLIMKKGYLMDTLESPSSFQDFAKHNSRIAVLYNLAKDTGKDSHKVENKGFPKEFDTDVKNSLNRLRFRYQNYLKQSAILDLNDK